MNKKACFDLFTVCGLLMVLLAATPETARADKEPRVHFSRQYEISIRWDGQEPMYLADMTRITRGDSTHLGLLAATPFSVRNNYPRRSQRSHLGGDQNSNQPSTSFFDHLIDNLVTISSYHSTYQEVRLNEREGHESIVSNSHFMPVWEELVTSRQGFCSSHFPCFSRPQILFESSRGPSLQTPLTELKGRVASDYQINLRNNPIPHLFLFSQRMESAFNGVVNEVARNAESEAASPTSSRQSSSNRAIFLDAIGAVQGHLQGSAVYHTITYDPASSSIITEDHESPHDTLHMQFHLNAQQEINYGTITDSGNLNLTLTFRAVEPDTSKYVDRIYKKTPFGRSGGSSRKDSPFTRGAFAISLGLGVAAMLYEKNQKP